MNNKMKLLPLTLSGVGSIIGSGWLFGAAHAAANAGPASILSWIIGAIIVTTIALSIIEISTTVPVKMGGFGYYLNYTHGSFVSFIADWALLVGFAGTVASEAISSVQYLSSWNYDWTRALFDTSTQAVTHSGLAVASLLCVVYFLINYYSLTFLVRSIKALTIFKIITPILLVLSLVLLMHHTSNLSAVGDHSFTPYGVSGIFTSITTAGIVYAFNGFQTPVTFASEAEHPKRNVPLAVILSLLICTGIYVALQYAYLTAVPLEQLQQSGWRGLDMASPFAHLAISLNINLITILLYASAFVSPFGAGLIYNASSARILQGMKKHVPHILTIFDRKRGIPVGALVTILIASFVALWLLPSWNRLAAVISVGYVLGYATAPVCASSFRKLLPRKFNADAIHIPGMSIFAPLGFIFATFMLYWSCWPLTGEVIFIVILGLPLYIYYEIKSGSKNFMLHLKKTSWFIIYLITVAVFSYFGSTTFGGTGVFPDVVDHIALVAIALFFFTWGRQVSYKTTSFIDAFERKPHTAAEK